jgi:hypothetical protein
MAAFTEFYVQTTGSNLNSGSTTNDAALFTYSGDWTNSTGAFYPSSGNPLTDGVKAGMYASVYTSGASTAAWVGYITNVLADSVWFAASNRSGAFPSDIAGVAHLNVGGAWGGPNTNSGFPFGFASGSLSHQTNSPLRVNIRTGTYSTTTSINSSSTYILWQGYSEAVGDGGKATIDGTTNGSSRTLMTASGVNQTWKDLMFSRNGGSGGGAGDQGVNATGNRNVFIRCVVRLMRSAGFYNASSQVYYIECEAYSNNLANTSTRGGFYTALTGTLLLRCTSHDNAGANSSGFYVDQSETVIDCIAYNNGADGFSSQADQYTALIGCDAWNNGGSGFKSLSASPTYNMLIEDCNFVKNARWGIESINGCRYLSIDNCGFGSGTMTNALGTITNLSSSILIRGTILYPTGSTPWTVTGTTNFTVVLPEAKHTGAKFYTVNGVSTNWGYESIGAAQRGAVGIFSGWAQ